MNTLARLPILFALVLASCTAPAVRQKVLLPSMASAWQHVRVLAEREAKATADNVGELAVAAADDAMASEDPMKIGAAPWQKVDALVEGDIKRRTAANEIGPLVAEELRERQTQFARARASYVKRSP